MGVGWLMGVGWPMGGVAKSVLESTGSRDENGESETLHYDFIFKLTGIEKKKLLSIMSANDFS